MPTIPGEISFQIWNTAFQTVLFNLVSRGTICGAYFHGAIATVVSDALLGASETAWIIETLRATAGRINIVHKYLILLHKNNISPRRVVKTRILLPGELIDLIKDEMKAPAVR